MAANSASDSSVSRSNKSERFDEHFWVDYFYSENKNVRYNYFIIIINLNFEFLNNLLKNSFLK